MPELPEVETVRRGLNDLILGKQISKVSSNWQKSFPNALDDIKAFMLGAQIKAISRRAKVLVIDLSSQYSLVIHLKMTGQLVFRNGQVKWGGGHPSVSLIGRLPDKSTRVIIEFTDDSQLFFNDQRKFGWVRLLPTMEVPSIDFFKKVGPEPLSPEFTWQVMANRLKRRQNSSIKATLLDQTVLAGIGNIYADESLWMAKIHPSTRVKDLSTPKTKSLYWAIREVLLLSIEKGGSSDRNYVDAEGHQGNYLALAAVFRREGKACLRCGSLIIKLRVAGRGTHLCPTCQKLVPPRRP